MVFLPLWPMLLIYRCIWPVEGIEAVPVDPSPEIQSPESSDIQTSSTIAPESSTEGAGSDPASESDSKQAESKNVTDNLNEVLSNGDCKTVKTISVKKLRGLLGRVNLGSYKKVKLCMKGDVVQVLSIDDNKLLFEKRLRPIAQRDPKLATEHLEANRDSAKP